MFRKLKIGTRVNVLIAVPLLALIVLAVVGFTSLQRASVRGAEYRQLKVAQDLSQDLVAPRANLIAAWSSVAKIGVLVASPVTSRTTAEIRAEVVKLDERRAAYLAAVEYWRSQPMPEAQRVAFENGVNSGEDFFDKVDSVLVPQVQNDPDPSIVLSAVRAIEYDYNIQQVFVQELQRSVLAEVDAREQSTDDFVGTVQLVIIAAVAGLLLLVLAVAFLVRRSIVGPILALSEQARHAADHELPDAVRQIQQQSADAPLPDIAAFHTETRDELADLSASFTSVQSAALALAAEQAQARRTVAENLVSIARRTQSLLGRSLTSLSEMEANERDPEALARLFRLDHLTTRMRRNAQSLLVLADAEQNRLWSPPVPVGDVVRAALSEIEHYARVDIGDLGDHGKVMVQGALAPDVAHLLAELLENATSFSSPSTRVMVVGRSVGSGHQLAIVDYGIGMSEDELAAANASLRRQADFGTESSKVLGFQVVARIAARFGIQVVLANTAGATGITAIIKLPAEVFDSRVAPPITASNGARLTPAPPAIVPVPVEPAATAATTATAVLDRPESSTQVPDMPAPVTEVRTETATGTSVSVGVSTPMPVGQSFVEHAVPADSSVAPASTPPRVASPTTAGGLVKRVRGAQMPDVGSQVDSGSWERPPDAVRSSLSSLQRGTDMARQRQSSDHDSDNPGLGRA